MARAHRRLTVLIGVAVFLAGGSCRQRPHTDERGGLMLPAGTPVTYSTVWTWAGATYDAARRSYSFRTDRGYTVRIEAGYIGMATLELVPCRIAPASPQGALLDLVTPRSALASHGYAHDSSLAEAPFVEPIQHDSRFFAQAKSSGKTYCQLHELLAPLDKLAGDGFHMDHWSAYVRGGYVLPSGGPEHPFEAHVNLRGGALVDLHPGDVPGDGPVRVQLTRSPLRAFDGVVMEKLTSSELAYAFLRGLTKGTTAQYSLARN